MSRRNLIPASMDKVVYFYPTGGKKFNVEDLVDARDWFGISEGVDARIYSETRFINFQDCVVFARLPRLKLLALGLLIGAEKYKVNSDGRWVIRKMEEL